MLDDRKNQSSLNNSCTTRLYQKALQELYKIPLHLPWNHHRGYIIITSIVLCKRKRRDGTGHWKLHGLKTRSNVSFIINAMATLLLTFLRHGWSTIITLISNSRNIPAPESCLNIKTVFLSTVLSLTLWSLYWQDIFILRPPTRHSTHPHPKVDKT